MHQPVLLTEVMNYLITDPEGIYLDGTLGGGGHTRELAQKLSQKGHIYALDRDQEVLQKTLLNLDQSRITAIHTDFSKMQAVLAAQGINQVTGILLDLGVSSFQLDEQERGFSFHIDAPLDMRMDRSQMLNAQIIVNSWSEAEIAQILKDYGEERYARAIARAIVKSRLIKPIDSTLDLVELIKSAVPAAYRREKHPARRTFQGLRIAVNRELEALKASLPQAVELLQPGGRLCIITFHSLEDRIVKQFFVEQARTCICPPDFPICVCGVKPILRLVKRKGIEPSDQEIAENPRARSAKLRIAEKI